LEIHILFFGSVVDVCSLVCWLLVVFVGIKFMIWGPVAAVEHVRAFSLFWCLLFYFVCFGFPGLGSYAGSWSWFFFLYYDYFLGRFKVFFFFLSKKYCILKTFQNQSGIPKYRDSHTVFTGLPQQRGNQSSQQKSQA
jgi:hypothetical protein